VKWRGSADMLGLVLAICLLMVNSVHAQSTTTAQIPQVELKPGEKTAVANQPSSGGIDPIRCDSRGNIYMRPVSAKSAALAAPILRISADAQNTTFFDVSSVPEIKESPGFEIYDFAITKTGKILAVAGIATKGGNPFAAVIQVDGDDKSASLIRIDSNFSPRQIAPMPSGMFLLSGVQHSTKFAGPAFKQTGAPFTAIFDSRGKLVKEIQLPGDIKIEEIDASKVEKPDITALQAVDLSRFVVADDGTIYMLRSGPMPKVYVISSAGEVIRSFPVATPPGDVTLSSIFFAAGRLAFDFYLPASKDDSRVKLLIRIVDSETGRILWDYVPTKEIYGIPACYSGQDFTLLAGTQDHRLALWKVSPQ